jgi:hypothetical protein
LLVGYAHQCERLHPNALLRKELTTTEVNSDRQRFRFPTLFDVYSYPPKKGQLNSTRDNLIPQTPEKDNLIPQGTT